ncbi:hypothetical protein L1987_14802 [Smallanthus sonchifolius]|uniref:Uncharacterized protein n=1 Tax=Smallanthus sonchifolius TaxID=185202 RepID=A0ACB9J616_9ASTR|nr:hypothetical protein L1987_14802 [Smallanthus sonchifolius]
MAYSSGSMKTLSGGSGPGVGSGTGTLKTPSGGSGPGASPDTGTKKTPSGGYGLGASSGTGTKKTLSGGSGAGAGSGPGTMKTLSGGSGASTGTTKTLSDGSGSYPIQSSGSEEDLQHLMDQRRKNRMISNRESARRSRKRKQKHLDDLTTQLSQLRKQNNEMLSSVNITTQHYMNIETENRVLRARVAELSHQLQSLNDIIGFMFMYPSMDTGCGFVEELYGDEFVDELMNNSLSYVFANQPILASADMFMY